MSTDHTQRQSSDDESRSRELSLKRTKPPIEVPGYETRQFLGSGAYGEVWVALDKNTGRRVAIKFYMHRGGLDWSLLSREVEKLVFLSADRYVVQLLDVGWDSDPPYYVMEFIEGGSLEEYIQKNDLIPVGEAVEIFRGVATGLLHAHGRGVLHCDLKPANVLLDQDNQPRLADFGQSRLSHEQTPALGTLFYMAPEQADMKAVPDARWDVYALGALMFCMLTGQPPYRRELDTSQLESGSLDDRLERYRELIIKSPPPQELRQDSSIDRPLAAIVERCLAVDAANRFPNVQSVLDALAARDRARDQRPLKVLGILGPLLLVALATLFGWQGFERAAATSNKAIVQGKLESNRQVARYAAEAVSRRFDRFFRTVENVSNDEAFVQEFLAITKDPDCSQLLNKLDSEGTKAEDKVTALSEFRQKEPRRKLEATLHDLLRTEDIQVASWFANDEHGTQIAAAFPTDPIDTLGKNYSWRSYFNGVEDVEKGTPQTNHIADTFLSQAFQSKATGAWKVAVSTPIWDDGKFAGIVALTIELGHFDDVTHKEETFVLIDGRRDSSNRIRGTILQHPLYSKLLAQSASLEKLGIQRVPIEEFIDNGNEGYFDPVAQKPDLLTDRDGKPILDLIDREQLADPDKRWIASIQEVDLEQKSDKKQRLIILVQSAYDDAVEPVRSLRRELMRLGLAALGLAMLVGGVLWYVALRVFNPNERLRRHGGAIATPTPLHSMETMELPDQFRRG